MDKYKGEDLETISPAKWQLLSTSFFANKDLAKVKTIADLFNHHAPDILMLTEVGGQESLENFNTHFLHDRYQVLLEPSNSDRGIDLGYLVKKDLPFTPTLISHTQVKLENGKKFARGVFELRLLEGNKPRYINFLTHLKSKLDLRKEDFEGRTQRMSEVRYLKKIFKKRCNEFPKTPITISGDLNAIIYKDQTEPELQELIDGTFLQDIFELQDKSLSERITYCYFDSRRDRYDMQLDYILIPKKYQDQINHQETKVLNFYPQYPLELPDNLAEKLSLPSDHFPIQCKINL